MEKRRSFTAGEKLKAVQLSKSMGSIRAAAEKLGIEEKNIRNWRKAEENLREIRRNKRAKRGKAASFPELENILLKWIYDRRSQGLCVSTFSIRLKARQIAESLKIDSDKFKASMSWCRRFMVRKNMSIRRRTHIAQHLPDELEHKLIEFQKFVIHARQLYDYPLSQIGNADQTPMTLDLVPNTTVSFCGDKSVNIRTTGAEKLRFTVMLSCTADGGKLPPYVVIKRKTLPKDETFPPGVIVRCQDNGWFDDKITEDWVKSVWKKRPGALLRQKSLLVLDAFKCHRKVDIKLLLKEHLSKLVIIPGGLTSLVQPMDVSLNKPIKDAVKQKWSDWMAEGEHTFTKGGKMRHPTYSTVARWIYDAWNDLDPAIIVRTFKKCCISNALDGTEDDILFDHLIRPKQGDPNVQEERPDSDDDSSDDETDLVYNDEDADDPELVALVDNLNIE